MGSAICSNNAVPTDPIISKFGGFSANSVQIKCSVKTQFVSLLIFQGILIALLYSYYKWEQTKRKELGENTAYRLMTDEN